MNIYLPKRDPVVGTWGVVEMVTGRWLTNTAPSQEAAARLAAALVEAGSNPRRINDMVDRHVAKWQEDMESDDAADA